MQGQGGACVGALTAVSGLTALGLAGAAWKRWTSYQRFGNGVRHAFRGDMWQCATVAAGRNGPTLLCMAKAGHATGQLEV